MNDKKIFILLPDGVGLRNFAFTDFYEKAVLQGFKVEFWNNTPFDLNALGFNEKRINKAAPHFITDLYKRARTDIDLEHNKKKSGSEVYDSYRFFIPDTNIKIAVKSFAVSALRKLYGSQKGLQKLRGQMKNQERKTAYYQRCLKDLKEARPDLVFCTNQRPLSAVSPILAAQDLGIPTATFVFPEMIAPLRRMIRNTLKMLPRR